VQPTHARNTGKHKNRLHGEISKFPKHPSWGEGRGKGRRGVKDFERGKVEILRYPAQKKRRSCKNRVWGGVKRVGQVKRTQGTVESVDEKEAGLRAFQSGKPRGPE